MPASVVVVDNASSDGTAEAVAERHPGVRVVRNERNLGFGAAINRAALELDGDLLVLVNNDVVCEPEFLERITAPFADASVGMVAGVLLQASAPGLVDSAGNRAGHDTRFLGLPLEPTRRRACRRARPGRALWRRRGLPAAGVQGARRLRRGALRLLGGRRAGAPTSGARVGAACSQRARGRCTSTDRPWAPQRRRRGGWRRSAAATCSRSTASAGIRSGRRRSPRSTGRCSACTCSCGAKRRRSASGSVPARAAFAPPTALPPLELATVGFAGALGRQAQQLRLRLTGGLPAHFSDGARAPRADTPETRRSDSG